LSRKIPFDRELVPSISTRSAKGRTIDPKNVLRFPYATMQEPTSMKRVGFHIHPSRRKCDCCPHNPHTKHTCPRTGTCRWWMLPFEGSLLGTSCHRNTRILSGTTILQNSLKCFLGVPWHNLRCKERTVNFLDLQGPNDIVYSILKVNTR
jgi:hypothetical protein